MGQGLNRWPAGIGGNYGHRSERLLQLHRVWYRARLVSVSDSLASVCAVPAGESLREQCFE